MAEALPIGNDAFQGCSKLANCPIPNTVTTIGDGAFSGTALTNVVIPEGVIAIGNEAYQNCEWFLTNVSLPNTLTSIGSNTFFDCASLLSITIPSSVTNLAPGAFFNTAFPAGIYFTGNAPTLGENAFGFRILMDFPLRATLYYLAGTTGWSSNYGGYTDILWNPQAQTGDAFFGVRTNRFGFNITGSSHVTFGGGSLHESSQSSVAGAGHLHAHRQPGLFQRSAVHESSRTFLPLLFAVKP